MHRSPLRSWGPVGLGLALLVIGLALTLYLAHRHQRNVEEANQQRISNIAQSLAISLERYVGSLAVRSEALAAIVEMNPEVSASDLEHLAKKLMGKDAAFRNLALAPDDVVTFVYPRAGNEAVLGLILSQRADMSEVVHRIRDEDRTVLAGPLNLVQGGVGLVTRSPVFVVDPNGQRRYWGLTSLVVDYAIIAARVGIDSVRGEANVALRGRDASGVDGEIFFGRPDLFDDARVTAEIPVPGGSWQLAAEPRDGWVRNWVFSAPLLPLGMVLSIVFAVLGFRIASDRVAIRELAMSDPLTRLPNRRHVQWHLAECIEKLGSRVQCGGLVLIDFDDFKPVNDLLGHRIGDEVLREIAGRMRSALGPNDVLGRIGGDEFLMVHSSMTKDCRSDVESTASRLLAAISQPIHIEDQEIRVRASMGLALFPQHARSAVVLRECADRALYQAKSEGGSRALVYRSGAHDINRVSGSHQALPQ